MLIETAVSQASTYSSSYQSENLLNRIFAKNILILKVFSHQEILDVTVATI